MVTYKLKEPVKFGDKIIAEITLRKPKMADLKGISMKDIGVEQMGVLFGRLCSDGHTTAVFDMMGWEDGMAISELIGDFLPASQKTGKG